MFEAVATFTGGLPSELKYFIGLGVLYLVRLLLAGRVPDAWLSEVAAVITGALIAFIELGLGLIPGQFDAVVAAVLQLIVVLLGSVFVINGYRLVRNAMLVRGLRP